MRLVHFGLDAAQFPKLWEKMCPCSGERLLRNILREFVVIRACLVVYLNNSVLIG